MIKKEIVDIKSDGSVWLNQKYFRYATGLRMINEKRWKALFGFGTRKPEDELVQHHCNLALAIQRVTEEIVIKMAEHAAEITGCENLCLAGGVALNCVANGKLLKREVFKNIYIQPAAGDAGGALGAALAADFIYFKTPRVATGKSDLMRGSYLGPDYSEKEIASMIKSVKGVAVKYQLRDELNDFVAKRLAAGDVVGWFNGRMEFGPRALGSRSILGDARNPEMQKKLNLKIKYREGFRPFAPSVLAEDCNQYFDLNADSPYMLLVAPVKEERRTLLPENYGSMGLWERLYYLRSDIQSVTHLDFSARIQTVHKETNPHYYSLIEAFKKLTGYSLVVNTSFNVRGEPIVCTPFDAYRCFMSTEMDILVVDNFVFVKTEQPDWKNKDKWTVKFKMD